MIRIEENNKFQEAISFLKEVMNTSGKNSKPVVEHSLRMADYLYAGDYSDNIIIGAILHDVLEDTAVELGELEKKFGTVIAGLVEVNSFDENIEDRTMQYKKIFARCLNYGVDALIIKAADILDNSNYYHLAKTAEDREGLMQKMKYFVDLSVGILKNDIVWQDLDKQYKFLRAQE